MSNLFKGVKPEPLNLSPDGFEHLANLVANPPPMSEALREAAERYNATKLGDNRFEIPEPESK